MSSFTNESTSPDVDTETVVETNNFHQVIEHFNAIGDLINKKTRFAIECQICRGKNLAITNRLLDPVTESKHEKYTVLPRCGHAFGYSCLHEWITTQKAQGQNPKCPSCRAPILCQNGHTGVITEHWASISAPYKQREDICVIRHKLSKTDCIQCERLTGGFKMLPFEDEIPERHNQVMPLHQRVEWMEAGRRAMLQEQAAFRQQASGQQARVRALLRQSNEWHDTNERSWELAALRLSTMHNLVRPMSDFQRPTYDTLEIVGASERIDEAITELTGQLDDTGAWARIRTQLDSVQQMAEERMERERRTTELTALIQAQLSALETLVRDSIAHMTQ
ncbi:hypothetical protein ONZ43_g6235 [Nemania bipapillata]|uniref:Uncharacterized protein n=1 Tax=Nemania bipapillata TaxID=110536 RepID=A0ACC2I1G2_9PEZI|nr:hypothetical protein ONZ43_g6235 [Nemania bipapillata]